MKKTITRLSSLSVVALMLFAACDSRHAAQLADSDADTTITEAIADSSVYGIVGEGTAMHTLEVITDVGDTLEFVLADADTDVPTVLGGLLAGDRVAVVSHTADGEQVADKVVNITSLLGKWTSIDKSFEIREGGIVESAVKAETNPWTSWKLNNGNIILNSDTFQIDVLGPDSLCLETADGIFAYKRQQ